MKVGDTVRFKEDRNGTFEPGTELVVKEAYPSGNWLWLVDKDNRSDFFIRTDRMEVVTSAAA